MKGIRVLERFVARGEQGSACRWIEDHAAAALRAGEWDELARCIRTIRPEAMPRGEAPAILLYWLAECELRGLDRRARATYEAAFKLFGETRDSAGQLRCAAGVVCSSRLLGLPDFARWVTALDRLWSGSGGHGERGLAACYQRGLLAAAPILPPRAAKLDSAARQLGAALDSIEDGCWRVAAAAWLLEHESRAGRGAEAAKHARGIAPLLDTPQVPASVRHAWHLALGVSHEYRGDRRAAIAALDAADAIAGEGILPAHRAATATRRMMFLLRSDELEAAAALERLLGDCEGALETALALMARAWLAFGRGEPALSANLSKAALTAARGAGDTGLEARCAGLMTLGLSGCGRHEEAESAYRALQACLGPLLGSFLRLEIQLCGALIALDRGDAALGLRRLGRAMKAGEAQGHTTVATRIAPLLGRLCAIALRAGMRTDYAVSLVRQNGLWTDDCALERWPWPIRIRVMDRLEVLRDGAPVRSSRKAQKKPLDLLKAIVAHGGRGITASSLIEDLWPDSEGDAGQRALDAALLRLRRLLGHDDAVLLSGRKISLNPRVCWVDAWALERIADAGGEAARGDLARTADAVLRLYRGGFLEKEEPRPWAIVHAERLRSKFMRCMLRIGAGLEDAGRADQAIAVYRRCVEVDPLAEELTVCLMQAHARLGHVTEGLAAFRRYRDISSVVLGVRPSAKAEAAYRTLLAVFQTEPGTLRSRLVGAGPDVRGNE